MTIIGNDVTGFGRGAAVPSVVPPPEWGPIQRDDYLLRWFIAGMACSCEVAITDAGENEEGLVSGLPCDSHPFSALDSGLALLRGALAQQRTEP